MAEDPNVILKRDNHLADLALKCHQLLQLERFVDITLGAEGGSLKAHRLVLSSSSEYFEEILSQQPSDPYDTIILDNVSFSDLKLLIEFMYKGKVIVNQEKLPSFLEAAFDLKIKGLLDRAQGCENDIVTPPSEPDAARNHLAMSQGVPESTVSFQLSSIRDAKGPGEEEDPLFDETESAADGASMEWENTDDAEFQHLSIVAEIGEYKIKFCFEDKGVERNTMEGRSDSESEGPSESCESADSSLHEAAAPSLPDPDEDSIPSSRDGENHSGEEKEQENSECEEEYEMDQTSSLEDVDSDSSDDNFEPGKSLPDARSSRPKAKKPSSASSNDVQSSSSKKDSTHHRQRFKCKKCPRSYLQRESLLKHLRLECGKEPQFRCTVCDHRFARKSSLQRHLITVHKVDRSQLASYGAGPEVRPVLPFPCLKQCGFSFKSEKLLNQHRRLCGANPSFHCDHCDFSSKWKRNLDNHILNIHGVEPVK